jgi:hypothetical protein
MLLAAALAGLALVLLALLWRRSRPFAGAAAVTLHAAAQLALLAPATLSRDSVAPYLRRPAFAEALPAETRLVHGSVNRLFGNPPRRAPPGGEGRWLARQGAATGYPVTGVPQRWRYELANSPEGLDSFLTRSAIEAIKPREDGQRVRLLRVWGVEALLVERPLAPAIGDVRLLRTTPGPLGPVHLYSLQRTAPSVRRVEGARWAADPRQALAILLDTSFDPRTEVVLPGEGAATSPGSGTVRVEREVAEELIVSTGGDRAGWVVVQRAWQPLWRASVDGRAAATVAADIHRLGVAVPAGDHRLRLWVERAPLRRAGWAAAGGLAGLLALAATALRRRGDTS